MLCSAWSDKGLQKLLSTCLLLINNMEKRMLFLLFVFISIFCMEYFE